MRLALGLNALSCLLFGTLFLALPGPVGVFLGGWPAGLLALLGAGLLAYGAALVLAARRPFPPDWAVILFSAGDLGWWLASLALVAPPVGLLAPEAAAPVLAVGAMVAALGVAQLLALGRRRHGPNLMRRLGQSWMALRPAVKLWLGVLNLAFLLPLVTWPSPLAVTTLLAYVASGPLLLGMAAAQGGLTRALGLAHLLPWVPFLGWLSTQTVQSPLAALLAGVLAICLVLDLWDIGRWLKGERQPF